MKTETKQPNLEATVWTVAQTRETAARLADRARLTGLRARPGEDLEEVLSAYPSIVVIDPTGWEERCRRALNQHPTRSQAPPAVVFTGQDPLVIHTAGPAYAFVADSSLADLRAVVQEAQRARERFAPYWPFRCEPTLSGDQKRAASLFEAATGIEIRPERESAFREALRTRMTARLVPTPRQYAGLLEDRVQGAPEIEAMAGLLCVGETFFWRYSGQFLALERVLLPALLRSRGRKRAGLRLWSAGCSTGEEVYSLLIACLELAGGGAEAEVVGTDLHRPSLVRAEAGVYGERALRNMPPALRDRYLGETVPGGRRVSSALRKRAKFEQLNLGGGSLKDWISRQGPFDAIFCRNTLIYLNRPVGDRVIGLLESALADGGGLFLGASESLHPRRPGLEPVRAMGSFFYRKRPRPVPSGPDLADEPPPEDPSDGWAAERYSSALARLDSEDNEGARDLFQEIVAVCPEDARGHTGLAILLCNEGRDAEASEHLERSIREGPKLAATYYLLGLLAERRGHELNALSDYREALDADPDFLMAHVNRAWIFRRMGRQSAFSAEMKAALATLDLRRRVALWATGGMGYEALLSLLAEALAMEGGSP